MMVYHGRYISFFITVEIPMPSECLRDDFAIIRTFVSMPPTRRRRPYIYNPGSDYQRYMTISYFAGRDTWDPFREAVHHDHQTLGSSDPGYAWLLDESWSLISNPEPPEGWNAISKPNFEFDSSGPHLFGGMNECVVIREAGRGGRIVGFVSYRLLMHFDPFFLAPRKPSRRQYHHASFEVSVDLIYVLPSYRGKGFGTALREGVYNRVVQFLEHLLDAQVDGLRVLLDNITVFGDCDSDEGYAWLFYLTNLIRHWRREERRFGRHVAALKRTRVVGDYCF